MHPGHVYQAGPYDPLVEQCDGNHKVSGDRREKITIFDDEKGRQGCREFIFHSDWNENEPGKKRTL